MRHRTRTRIAWLIVWACWIVSLYVAAYVNGESLR